MTHPLERLKRIADETIRKQAIENFSQEYYDENSKNDNGNLESAIMWSFDWLNSPQKYDYWNQIWNLSITDQLELLPEEPSEFEKVKLENEKLREFAANYVTHVENNIINNVYSADELTLLIPFVNLKDQAKQLLNQLEK